MPVMASADLETGGENVPETRDGSLDGMVCFESLHFPRLNDTVVLGKEAARIGGLKTLV